MNIERFIDPVETMSISTIGSMFEQKIVTGFRIPHGYFDFGFDGVSTAGKFVDEPWTFEKMQSMIDKFGKYIPAAQSELWGDDYIDPVANVTVSKEFARIQSPELVEGTNAWLKDRYGTYTPVYQFLRPWDGRPYFITSHENVARIKDAIR